jgi:hypothetical protein
MAKSKKPDTDAATLLLIDEVRTRKAEIAKSERPTYVTNCAFPYDEGRADKTTNLQVEADVGKLIQIAAFLHLRQQAYLDAASQLSVENPPPFKWGGYAVGEWFSDIKTRIGKIQIAEKRKKLEVLEARLNAVISPELRRQMELEAIAADLK